MYYHVVIENLLYEISQIVVENKPLKEMLEMVLLKTAEKLGMKRGMIAILDRKTNEIMIRAAYGLSNIWMEKGRYKVGEGITGQVVESGETVFVANIASEPKFLNKTGIWKKDDGEGLSFLCIPVKSGCEVLGTIAFDKKYVNLKDAESDIKVLTIISAMITQAMRLYQAEHEEKAALIEENERLQTELKSRFKPANIIGTSKAMMDVFTMVEKVASTNSSVLILGESGVGKELIAQEIHYNSKRADKPFIKFNCAALPESLAETELFGCEKGAYTGAYQSRRGRFESADSGTLFLDEIGELGPSVQSKFLRVLQEREFEKVGGNNTVKVDIRIIAATNKDLAEEVKNKTFREDLYYRLSVFPIIVPPLRERKTDIPMLADYFIDKYSKMNAKSIKRISSTAIDLLVAYHWPGNVRELENCVERAVILSNDGVIHAYHLPPTLQTDKSSKTAYSGTLQKAVGIVEHEMIVEKLKAAEGNMALAAKELGLTERIMGLRMKKYGIDYRLYRKVVRNKKLKKTG
ncbi:MAG: sigma 54-interacting transcriptional regulator [Candidatus Goldbacteria bacterium]|nr:sigma 54-interacting transcriptional regulator [Candidatus Goldiibacteriota bacterium]